MVTLVYGKFNTTFKPFLRLHSSQFGYTICLDKTTATNAQRWKGEQRKGGLTRKERDKEEKQEE
jgi:hypothetical protein